MGLNFTFYTKMLYIYIYICISTDILSLWLISLIDLILFLTMPLTSYIL